MTVYSMEVATSSTTLNIPASSSSRTSGPVLNIDHARYQACHLFLDTGVEFCIWAEDALSAHGIPTVVFDVYLLVEDVQSATKILTHNGFTRKCRDPDYDPVVEFFDRYVPPGTANKNAVVLLSAADWSFDFQKTSIAWLPPFPDLLDSLLCRWTDHCSRSLRMHLAVLIGYCYIYKNRVKTLGYVVNLRKENQQLHLDLVDGPATGNLTTQKCQEHYRAVREQIRKGELVPIGQSSVCLFPYDTFHRAPC
nr:hypothetical protein CFP56_03049 [Quercus suber]